MKKIRITKEFTFEMAHALRGHDGKCANIHGHSYTLSVTLIGVAINDETNPKNGMVMDFADLKKIIKEHIVDLYDHALLLHEKHDIIPNGSSQAGKVIRVDYQPTCENMVVKFAEQITPHLPPNTQLFRLGLRETSTSYAEYYPSDN